MTEKVKVYEEKTSRSNPVWMWLLPLLLLALLASVWMGRRHKESSLATEAAMTSDAPKPDGNQGNTPWTAGTIANSIRTNGRVSFSDTDVHFATGSASLANDSQAVLDQTAKALTNNSDWKVRIVGHTDSTGSPQLNDRLAQQRANSVVVYLVAHGVQQSRLRVDAKGEAEPVNTNATNNGRAENRRVELIKD